MSAKRRRKREDAREKEGSIAERSETAETFVEKPKTLAELRAEIAAGRTKAADLAASYYDRIAEINPRLNVYLSLTKERALEQAARVDAAAAKGDPLPPLAGIPVGIKDVLVMKGAPATAGSKILKGYRPPYDATAVAKLEAAGAVLLGKLNCDEFAMGSSNENSAYGPVRNPVDTERVPGGSSGGSAAAVAANLAVATLGTDTGGSIRQPASFCGVVGVLPTYGRVSRYGLIAFASSLDRVGPFAANVRDAATLLGVIAGHDPKDATSSTGAGAGLCGRKRQAAAEGPAHRRARGVFRRGLDPEVRAAIEKGIDALRAAGCTVKPISLPHTSTRFRPTTWWRRPRPAPTWPVLTACATAIARRLRIRCRRCTGTRATRVSAPRSSGAFCWAPTRFRAGYYDAYYLKAQQVRRLLAEEFLRAFAEVDAIVTPTSPMPAFKLGEKTGDPLAMYLADIYTVTASLAGICGVTVPCGATQAGLPVGMQVLGGALRRSERVSRSAGG